MSFLRWLEEIADFLFTPDTPEGVRVPIKMIKEEKEKIILTPTLLKRIRAKMDEEVFPARRNMRTNTRVLDTGEKNGVVVYEVITSNASMNLGSADSTNWSYYLVGTTKGFFVSESWVSSESRVYFNGVIEDDILITIQQNGEKAVWDGALVSVSDIVFKKSEIRPYTDGPVRLGSYEQNINTDNPPLEANRYCNFSSDGPFRASVKKHYKAGRLIIDPDEIELENLPYLRKGDSLEGLYFDRGLNTTVLRHLLSNPNSIPNHWKGKIILFPGTIYTEIDSLNGRHIVSDFCLGLVWTQEPIKCVVKYGSEWSVIHDCYNDQTRTYNKGWVVITNQYGLHEISDFGRKFRNTYIAIRPV